MKRNGMCPICFVKRFFNVPSKVSEVYPADFYGNGADGLVKLEHFQKPH